MDSAALFKIGYGLYVLTANDGIKDNGCIINTLLQVTSSPTIINTITVSKQNYTHEMIMNSKQFNVSILSVDVSFDVFKHFGFQSGKDADKLSGYNGVKRSENGLIYLTESVNAYLSHKVTNTIDFGTHTMFVGEAVAGEILSAGESVTYSYYHQHIKPKPSDSGQSKGYRCKICGYVYEGDSLPANFICPTCKHGASDFEKIL